MSQLLDKLKKDTELETRKMIFEIALEYGVDIENRIIRIEEEIDEGLAGWLDTWMTFLETDSQKGITIKINTYGGDIYTTNAMVARIRSSKRRITTIGTGKVMSAGLSLIASGHIRRAYSNTRFMHHQCAYDMAYDKHREGTSWIQSVEEEEGVRFRELEEMTGTTETFWESKAKNKPNYFFNAERAKELGLIDEVI
jgi:ATP-dependent protease ClpP protease subunit